PAGIYTLSTQSAYPLSGFPPRRLSGVSVSADTTFDIALGGDLVTGTVHGPGGVPLYECPHDRERNRNGCRPNGRGRNLRALRTRWELPIHVRARERRLLHPAAHLNSLADHGPHNARFRSLWGRVDRDGSVGGYA